ncbi:MAG: electron transport complex subunit RsxE [Pseudomonadales bacterium]
MSANGSPAATRLADVLTNGNPAWTHLLGLCPLLAVSTSVVNALALALATTTVLVGSSVAIASSRHHIPTFARLPAFVLIIATWTTCAVMLLEAYAYPIYDRIGLFVQIIVTNCIILARAESFASRVSPIAAARDALAVAVGFAMALVLLGGVRELLGKGTLFADMEQLFGPTAAAWKLVLPGLDHGLFIVILPPGAFLTAGLLIALGRGIAARRSATGGSENNRTDTAESRP